MRLSAKYEPTTLDEVVGQPGIMRRLKELVANPAPGCALLEGRGGLGKSAAAKALALDLGVSEYAGLTEYAACRLKIEDVDELFNHKFRLTPMMGVPWHILVIEELERCVSDAVNSALKYWLSEQHIPSRLIVIATSNDASGLDEALLQRFDIYPFSCGPSFAAACIDRLGEIWHTELGEVEMPAHVAAMGWKGESYSMRRALAALGAVIDIQRHGALV
jgi:replication-associated recombination protein RarA